MRRLYRKASGRIRWRRILASCNYDPLEDDDVLEATSEDFVIAGCPRSGTSLLAAQLFRPPDVITCMEPWDGLRMPLNDLMSSLRHEVRDGVLARGRLDLDALRDREMIEWMSEGAKTFHVSASEGFQLGVKWPAFWRYVPLLEQTRFLICVRDPAQVITSFSNSGGRLAQGLDYDVAMNRAMNRELARSTANPEIRRALLWEYINSRLVPHLNRKTVKVVRYERWFTDPENLLSEVGDFLGVEISGSIVSLSPPATRSNSEALDLAAVHCPSARAMGYAL